MQKPRVTVAAPSAALAAAIFLASAPPAQAAVLFQDNFESSPATPYTAQEQALNPTLRSDHDPVNTTGAADSLAPGMWFHYAKATTPEENIQVTNNVGFPATGTYEGANVLRMRRSAQPPSSTGAMAAYIGPQTEGTIRATWKMMYPDQRTIPVEQGGITFPVSFFFTPYADNDHTEGTAPDGFKTPLLVLDTPSVTPNSWARVYQDRNATRIELDSPESGHPQLFHAQWQDWTLEADLDAQTFNFTVDGITSPTFDFNFPGGFSALTWRVAEANAPLDPTIRGTVFLDDVLIERVDPIPEPAMAGLLSLASLALLGTRRRRSSQSAFSKWH